MSADEITDTKRLFDVLESSLRRNGGPFLSGTLSLADLAFVPTMIRIMSHGPDTHAWSRTQAWYERLMSRDSVREWMREAESLPPVVLDGYRD